MQQVGLAALVGEALAVAVGDHVAGRVDEDDEGQVGAVFQREVADGAADHLVHVPQIGANLLRHAHAVAGVARVAIEVHRVGAQEVALHGLVVEEAAAGQDHALVRPHAHRLAARCAGFDADHLLARSRADQPVGRRLPQHLRAARVHTACDTLEQEGAGLAIRVEPLARATRLVDVDPGTAGQLGVFSTADAAEVQRRIDAVQPVDEAGGPRSPGLRQRHRDHPAGTAVQVGAGQRCIVDAHDQPARHAGAGCVAVCGLLFQHDHRRALSSGRDGGGSARTAEADDDDVCFVVELWGGGGHSLVSVVLCVCVIIA